MLTVKFFRILFTIVRYGGGLLFWLLGTAGATDSTLLVGGAIMIKNWLTQPVVFIPLITLGTLLLTYDVLSWLVRRNNQKSETYIPMPNWSLRKAFEYLRFSSRWAMQFNDETDCVLAAPKAMEDQMRLGNLTVWGRDRRFSNASQEKIDPTFWTGGVLEAFSLWTVMADESALSKPAPYLDRGQRQFRDLAVDQRQFKKNWPAAPIIFRPIIRKKMQSAGVDKFAKEKLDRSIARKIKWQRRRAVFTYLVRKYWRQLKAWTRRLKWRVANIFHSKKPAR